MPTIVDALKKKYPDATGNTIDEVINTIDASGGSDGGGALNIALSVTTGEHNETIYKLDTTWIEIKNAFIAGKIIIFTAETDLGTTYGYVKVVSVESYDGITTYSVAVTFPYSMNADLYLSTYSEDDYPEYISI